MYEVNCTEVLREVELYLDGELDPERAAGLAEHLHGCNPCFRRAEFRIRLKEIVRAKCRSEAPVHLTARIRLAIRSDPDEA